MSSCLLGSDAPSSQLGDGTIAGDMVWSRQATYASFWDRSSREGFFAFLPNGEAFCRAAALIRWFLGPVTDFEMQPVLQAGEIPEWCRLGESPRRQSQARLVQLADGRTVCIPCSRCDFCRERTRVRRLKKPRLCEVSMTVYSTFGSIRRLPLPARRVDDRFRPEILCHHECLARVSAVIRTSPYSLGSGPIVLTRLLVFEKSEADL